MPPGLAPRRLRFREAARRIRRGAPARPTAEATFRGSSDKESSLGLTLMGRPLEWTAPRTIRAAWIRNEGRPGRRCSGSPKSTCAGSPSERRPTLLQNLGDRRSGPHKPRRPGNAKRFLRLDRLPPSRTTGRTCRRRSAARPRPDRDNRTRTEKASQREPARSGNAKPPATIPDCCSKSGRPRLRVRRPLGASRGDSHRWKRPRRASPSGALRALYAPPARRWGRRGRLSNCPQLSCSGNAPRRSIAHPHAPAVRTRPGDLSFASCSRQTRYLARLMEASTTQEASTHFPRPAEERGGTSAYNTLQLAPLPLGAEFPKEARDPSRTGRGSFAPDQTFPVNRRARSKAGPRLSARMKRRETTTNSSSDCDGDECR